MADFIVNRGFHAPTGEFVYWVSAVPDPTGISYVGPPRFSELSNVSVVSLQVDDLKSILHRGFYGVGDEFEYWNSPGWDPIGAQYAGPPAFETLDHLAQISTSYPLAQFPKSLTFLQTTAYSATDVSILVPVPGQAFVIGADDTLVGSAGDGIYAVPPDGGAAVWQWDNGGSSTRYNSFRANTIRTSSDGAWVYATHRRSASMEGTVKLNAITGAVDWDTQPDGMNAEHRGVGVSPDGTRILVATNDQSGGDLKHLTLYDDTGAILDQVLFQGTTGYTIINVALLANDRWCITTSAGTDHDRVWFGDLADIENPTHWIDVSADPTVTATMNTTAQLIVDPLNGDHVWVAPNDNEDPKLYKLDASVVAGGAAMLLLELEPAGDTDLSGTNRSNNFSLDKHGHAYVTAHQTTSPFASDVLRYDNDGVLCYSMRAEGQTANLPAGSGNYASSIAVDPVNGNVFLGTEAGTVSVWSQT